MSTQRALPWWVRARGMGLYMLVLSGSIAIGSALWGAHRGVEPPGRPPDRRPACCWLGTATARRWRLRVVHSLDLRPAAPTDRSSCSSRARDDGPVLVTVAYRVPPEPQREFTEAMRRVERDRRRSGAERWGLFRDLADTDRFVETFVVDTWAEHLRQHQRRTRTADVLMRTGSRVRGRRRRGGAPCLGVQRARAGRSPLRCGRRGRWSARRAEPGLHL